MSRDNNAGIIHFFFAIIVAYGHQFYLMGCPQYLPLFLGEQIQVIAVKSIFVITGYFVTLSFIKRKSFINFSYKRFHRIYPSLVICLFLTVIVFSFISICPLNVYYRYCWAYFSNLLLFPRYDLPGVLDSVPYKGAVNGSLWTIPIEIFLYFSVSFAIFIFEKISRYLFGIFAVILCFVCHHVYHSSDIIVYYGSCINNACNLIPFYLVGSIFAYYHIEKLLNVKVAFICLIFFTFVLLDYQYSINFLLIPYCVLSFCFKAEYIKINKLLDKNNISYPVYLYSFPSQQIVVLYFSKYIDSLNILFLISMVPVILLSIISERIVKSKYLSLWR